MLLCYPSGHYGNRQNKQHKLLCKPHPPVIGSREDSDTLPSMCHLISILFDLMAPDDQVWRETGRMRGGDTGQGREGVPIPFLEQNSSVTLGPNCTPTPLLLGPLPGRGWGSDQRRSHISPVGQAGGGGSCGVVS